MENETKDQYEIQPGQPGEIRDKRPTKVPPVLWLGVALIVCCFYFQLFWLLAIAGLGLTIRFWKYRQSGDEKNGLCFFGVMLALTGIIGMIIQYLIVHF